MKVTVHLIRGRVEIQNVDQQTVFDMVEAFGHGAQAVMQFALDDGAQTYINKANIVRIDVD